MASSVADWKCRMRAALMLLAVAVGSVVGLSPRVVLAANPWHEDLARHWAPCIFQAVQVSTANPLGRYDLITGVDFDGDTCGGNNWENADDKRKLDFPLLPYVYYSVIETRSHYYIAYSLFHPRDWRWYLASGAPGAGAPLPATHENDLESATLVILKDSGYGKLRLIGTVCHLQNYCFVTDAGIRPKSWAWDLASGELQVSFFEGRPCLFVEAGGHGIGGLGRAMRVDDSGAYTIGKKQYRFGSGAGVVYRCSTDPGYVPDAEPVAGASVVFRYGAHQGPQGRAQEAVCEYQLIPLMSSLWPLRHDVGGEGLFEETFDYEVAPGCTLEDLPVFIAADGQDPGANPPWARDATGDGLAMGEWFFRPAQAMERYLDEWPDRDMPGYNEYTWNPYIVGAGTVTSVRPEGDRTWIAGYPMRIEWEISSAGLRLSDAVRVSVSGNAGKTWRPISVSVGESRGRTNWNVTGPAGDRCILAVRAELQCDPDLEVVGYSPAFSISEPEAFTWSVLNAGDEAGPARSDAPAVYDPDGDRLVLFGGRSTDFHAHSDTWVFDFGSMVWGRAHDGLDGAPEARWAHAAVWDSWGRLLISGGRSAQYLDDTWAFDFDTALWHRLDTAGEDVRAGGVAVYDPVGDRMVVFGGSDGETARNDVRALGLSPELPEGAVRAGPPPVPGPAKAPVPPGDFQWTTLHTGGGTAPCARVDAACAYDDGRRWLIIHGGRGGPMQDEPLADTWAFSLETYEWILLHDGSGLAPGARWGHAAVANNRTGDLVVFAGTGVTAAYGDVWLFNPDRLDWIEIPGGVMGSGPAPRSGGAAILRPSGGQVVVACGRVAAGTGRDVWSMGLRSLTPPREQPVQGGDEPFDPGTTVWPNPSTGEVSMGLAISVGGHLRLAVYDVRGRLVRLIHDSRVPAGYRTFHWDGEASNGAGVAGGVYFFRASMNGRSYERPIVMLR